VNTLTTWASWLGDHQFVATVAALGATAALVLLALAGWYLTRRIGRGMAWATSKLTAGGLTPGTTLAYLAALLAMGGSAVTSWQFFGEKVGLPPVDRVAIFAVLEVSLLACSAAMRAAARKAADQGHRRVAGPAATIAWALCGLSAGMALAVSGPFIGAIRVAAGPVVYLVMLHLALGIEKREHNGEPSTLEKLLLELRERALSRLGLGDDQRDALTRTRDRALHRAARLAAAKHVVLRGLRTQRAVRMAAIAGNPERLDALLDEINLLKHVGKLSDLDRPAPWTVPRQTGNQTTPTERTSVPDRTERTGTGPAADVPADQTSRGATAGQTTPAPDQTDTAPADRPPAVVRSLRTADGLTAAEVNARRLREHYRALIDAGHLPTDRQIRKELEWGGERVGKALEKLRELIDQEATA
jgi:hypothetical protein